MCKFRTCFGKVSKGPGQPVNICAVSPEHERINCKYFKRVCETVLVFGVPVQKVRDLQRLLRCLFSFENVSHEQWSIFCEILVLNSCVSSIGSNQPLHLCSLARAFTACTQCTYRICTYMLPLLTGRCNYPVSFSSKFWCINVVSAHTLKVLVWMRGWSNSFETSHVTQQ